MGRGGEGFHQDAKENGRGRSRGGNQRVISVVSCVAVDEMIAEVDIDGDGRIDFEGQS